MTPLEPAIRNAARALIIQRGQVLLLRKEGGGEGLRYALPGGAQEAGESLTDALQRECVEEIGTRVSIGPLLHVADYIRERSTPPPRRRHLVEFLFRCSVDDEYAPRSGKRPDKHQVAVEWVDLASVAGLTMKPSFLGEHIVEPAEARARAAYLGYFEDHADPDQH